MVVKVNYLLLMSSKWFQGHPVADDYDVDCNADIKVIGKWYKVTMMMLMMRRLHQGYSPRASCKGLQKVTMLIMITRMITSRLP